MRNAWEDEGPLSAHGIDVPGWIEAGISPSDCAAIVQGGCDSGAYMPAVTYYAARETMGKHGDDVLNYIQERGVSCSQSALAADSSWSGYACKVLSLAVELWASSALAQYENETK